MDERIKKKWTKWLRSGQYYQARKVLCRQDKKGNNNFCCLGVLSNIHAEETGDGWSDVVSPAYGGILTYGDKTTMPPASVRQWAGLSSDSASRLANMNDGGASFKKIADYIDKEL